METNKSTVTSEFLKYAEASKLLGVKTGTLYAWVSRRAIPHVRMSRRVVRFRRDDLEKWIEERRILPDPPA